MIYLKNLSLSHPNRPPLLQDVSLSLKSGGFYFLLGPSGSGKTTLLKTLALQRPVQSGELVMFEKKRIKNPAPVMRAIGWVSQTLDLIDELSVKDNICLSFEAHYQLTKDTLEQMTDFLTWYGLGDMAGIKTSDLSQGERQRVAIIRAIMHRPQIILADEPTSYLDSINQTKTFTLFHELNKNGTTIVFATHNKLLAEPFDKIYIQDQTLQLVPSQK
jgi:cell division transport system ATP-binding protein